MPTITLPDGTQKEFTDPVTIQQVAESIGPGSPRRPSPGASTDSSLMPV